MAKAKAKKELNSFDDLAAAIHEDYLMVGGKVDKIREEMATKAELREVRDQLWDVRGDVKTITEVMVSKADLVETIRDLLWKVSPSRDYGEPRQLAYKLDTIVINRRLDEQGRPLPKVIRLGSLRELAQDLQLGSDTASVRKEELGRFDYARQIDELRERLGRVEEKLGMKNNRKAAA